MEKGFDVFISFKNTDKNGERTQDSFMAEELYEALKEKGINAFYSNKSISERKSISKKSRKLFGITSLCKS